MAWLSLEAGDSEPARFWRYLLTALDSCWPGVAAPFLAHLRRGAAVDERLLTALINALLDAPEPILLVIDDYHLITDEAIHTGLSFLLSSMPATLRLMLLTRSDPPLPLARLRARAQVLELRTELLRCSEDETAQFFQVVLPVPLAPEQVRTVAERTEGWLVGLQLLGLWLQGSTNPGAALGDLSGTHHYILDYLAEEVLSQQPEPIRVFLRRTSVLDRLSAASCDAVLEQAGSQELLEYLARTNLFVVPLDMQRRWYRYHQLFAEALRRQLEQEERALEPVLYLRASRWYAAQGSVEQAIEYALRGQLWDEAATLVASVAGVETWSRLAPERQPLRQWLRRLPEQTVRASPRLSFAYARTMVNAGMPPAAVEPWLAWAEAGARAALRQGGAEDRPEQGGESERLLGEVLALRAFVHSTAGRYREVLRVAAETEGFLRPEHHLARADLALSQAIAALGLGDFAAAVRHQSAAVDLIEASASLPGAGVYRAVLAWLLTLQGRLHEAWRETERALAQRDLPAMRQRDAAYDESRQGDRVSEQLQLDETLAIGYIYPYRADILRDWHRLDEARAVLMEALERNRAVGEVPTIIMALPILARIHLSSGDPGAALATLEELDTVPHLARFRVEMALVEYVRAQLALGDLDAAQRRVASIPAEVLLDHPLAVERRDVALARIALARQQPREALDLLAPHLASIDADGRLRDAVQVALLQAIAHDQMGTEAAALSAVAQALSWAEPEGLLQLFVDEGPAIYRLLGRLQDLQGKAPFLAQTLAAFGQAHAIGEPQHRASPPTRPQGAAAPELVEPLSADEAAGADRARRHLLQLRGAPPRLGPLSRGA